MKVSRWQEPLPALVRVSLVQLQVFLHFLGTTEDLTRLAIQTSQWIHKYIPNLKILKDRNLQVFLNDPDAIFCSLYIAISDNCIIRQIYRPQDVLKVQVGFLYPNKNLPRPICSLWEWKKNILFASPIAFGKQHEKMLPIWNFQAFCRRFPTRWAKNQL